MQGVSLCQRQESFVKVLFTKCDDAWPTIPDNVLDNYVEDGRDNVFGSPQQASCGTQSNANGSQTASSSSATFPRRR